MTQDILARIAAVVGPQGLLTGASEMAPYLEEQRGLFHGKALAVVRPGSTEEVAAVVRLCAEQGIGIVPQGGNTGLCGGASPDTTGSEIILNVSRMNKIRAIDPVNFTMTVEAGVILQTVQDTASDADCLYPLSFGAEGSAQIGGTIATNAGGAGVLRYGNARDLVMGLEVVLPDGRIWDGLRTLRKDNTGYDLKHLFIGSEGSLGIITAAVLKLFPKPTDIQTAFCALGSLDAALALLSRARAATGDSVTTFELIPRIGLEIAVKHVHGVTDPLAERHDWYVLMELSSSRADANLQESLETLLGDAMEEGEVVDAVIASSSERQQALWRIREGIPEAQKREGGSIKHDVSVPISAVPEFIRQASLAVEAAIPGIRPVPFGHVGDGNIHFNLSQPIGADKQAYIGEWARMNRIVHDIVVGIQGSISAEHGIGQLKKNELAHYKAPLELDLMKRIKAAFDPRGLMNPGKIV
ncbi:FAD-binding oxidoreductase [Telmatospirillum siberiense]|uniref:Hydroxyacid dehydrogenase n=1 Tax=Telmatospirillum siberiense TaxID=382514 RepID=A0A2N3Q092_9PROT|nr:FAD-binding oxidoreductase [Telmatospirillum siberiense]PKU26073.1 hydroxyacid dehydrogenase [Telmatospirillum siberiense]